MDIMALKSSDWPFDLVQNLSQTAAFIFVCYITGSVSTERRDEAGEFPLFVSTARLR